MLRRTSLAMALTASFIAGSLADCLAQAPANTSPPTGTTGKAYAWTYRNTELSDQRALAFLIVSDSSGNLTGKLCMYKYTNVGGAKYTRKPITINSTSQDTVDCQVAPISGGYEIRALNIAGQTVPIGWTKSIATGKVLLIRWKKDTVKLDGVTIKQGLTSSPCDEPPADDVGEEEEIATTASSPLPLTLTLHPGPRPTPPSTSGE